MIVLYIKSMCKKRINKYSPVAASHPSLEISVVVEREQCVEVGKLGNDDIVDNVPLPDMPAIASSDTFLRIRITFYAIQKIQN